MGILDGFSLGSAIGGGLSAVGNLFGGYFQKKAQESANKTNLQIARENNQISQNLFHEQMDFNSFESQRRMLENAGYSPYSLFSTGNVSAPAAPNLQQATMMPTDAMGLAIGNSLGQVAQNIATLAQAEKSSQEAKGEAIKNAVYPKMLELQLKQLGLDIDSAEVQLMIQKATQGSQIEFIDLQNEVMRQGIKVDEQRMYQMQIANYFALKFGHAKNIGEINKMSAEAYKALMEGDYANQRVQQLPEELIIAWRNLKVNERQVAINEKRAAAQNALDYANVANINYILDTVKKTGASVDAMKIYELQGLGDKAKYEALTAEEGVRYQQLANDLLSEQITAAIRNNKWETVTKLFELAGKVMGGSFNYSIQSKH